MNDGRMNRSRSLPTAGLALLAGLAMAQARLTGPVEPKARTGIF